MPLNEDRDNLVISHISFYLINKYKQDKNKQPGLELCSSFRKAHPKRKITYYKVPKEKDEMIFYR